MRDTAPDERRGDSIPEDRKHIRYLLAWIVLDLRRMLELNHCLVQGFGQGSILNEAIRWDLASPSLAAAGSA
jgi:hypothetical protein